MKSFKLMFVTLFLFPIVSSVMAQPADCVANGQNLICTVDCNSQTQIKVSVSNAAVSQNVQKMSYIYNITYKSPPSVDETISSNQDEIAAPYDSLDYAPPPRTATYTLPLQNQMTKQCQQATITFSNCLASILAAQVTQKPMVCAEALALSFN